MNETFSVGSPLATAQNMFEQSKSVSEIEKHLLNAGHPAEEVAGIITQVKRVRHQRLSKMGMLLIAAGIVLCLVGFAVLITSTHEGTAFSFALYGLTGSGSLSIVGGMALILG